MGFKFLNTNIPDEPEYINQERFNELINHQPQLNRLSIDNRPAVFININRNRDTFSDDEWNSVIQQQRRELIEYMWDWGMVRHEIISQDEYGFTIRTEINF